MIARLIAKAKRLKNLKIWAVALVDRPANPEAKLVLWKSADAQMPGAKPSLELGGVVTMSVCRRCGQTKTREKCSSCDELDRLASKADGEMLSKAHQRLDFLEVSYGVEKGDTLMVDISKRMALTLTGQGWFVSKKDVSKVIENRADRILELGLATNRDAAYSMALHENLNPYQPRNDENPRLGDLFALAPQDEHEATADRNLREQARRDGDKLSQRARDLKAQRKRQGIELSDGAATLEVFKSDVDFKHEYNIAHRNAPLRKRQGGQ